MKPAMGLNKLPPRRAPRIGVQNVFDADGRPIHVLPDYIDADFMRSCFRKSKGVLSVDAEGGVITSSPGLVRAQIPYLVTLLVYKSKFQLTPIEQEWILYAPGDLKSAATNALTMWKRWFKPDRKPWEAPSGILMEDDFPMVSDGVIVEPIDDKFFDECWRYVKNRPHKSAGHPDKPWLFTCLEDDFAIYRHTDRQAGLRHRIN
jgi:hypothetical protein